jgi:hypothetical protein
MFGLTGVPWEGSQLCFGGDWVFNPTPDNF